MPKRRKKKIEDTNETAHRVFLEAIRELTQPTSDGKDPAAVALGRRGGLVGGRRRAERLTAARRKEIAAKAAAARWKGRKK